MKSILNKLLPALLVISLAACQHDDEESAYEKNVNALAATAWTHPTVTNTDGDLTDSYANFAILFTKKEANGYAGTFVISNGGYAFSEVTGQWKFNDAVTELQFDSGKTMAFTLDDHHLSLEFTVAPPNGGRTDGLSGHFVFEFSR